TLYVTRRPGDVNRRLRPGTGASERRMGQGCTPGGLDGSGTFYLWRRISSEVRLRKGAGGARGGGGVGVARKRRSRNPFADVHGSSITPSVLCPFWLCPRCSQCAPAVLRVRGGAV